MGKTILLADDSLTIQKVVELTFADTDYEVEALSSGDDLLQRLPDIRPDLVICDIIMPGRDGYEVCQEIKSDPSTLHIPVILLSGTFEPFDRDRALAAGCSEIITKPFEARKLVDTVERLLVGGTAEPPVPIEGTVEPPPVEPVAPPTEPPAERLPPSEELELAADSIAPEPSAAAEFAAQPEEEEHGLDFTDTGFAEMEAAGDVEAESSAVGPPEDGLDFEFSDDFGAFEESASSDQVESADTEPELEPHATHALPSPTPESELEPGIEPDFAEGLPSSPPEPEPDLGPPAVHDLPSSPPEPEPDLEPPAVHDLPSPTTEPEPESEPSSGPLPSTEPISDVGEPRGPFPEPSLDDSRPSLGADSHEPFIPEVEKEPEPARVEASPSVSETFVADDQQAAPRTTFPAEFELPAAEPQQEPEVEDVEASSHDASDTDADTAPVPPESGVPEQKLGQAQQTPPIEPAETPVIEPGPAVLSEQDIDRIARRILELSAERIENIAWEVVPDMAEVVVRQRIRELEAEAERAAAESHPD
jgi:CheY-like chemotaxis protein